MDTTVRLRSLGAPRVVASLDYLDAAPRGGVERERLDVLLIDVAGLPPDLDALVACSDLQGREVVASGTGRLLGEIVPEWPGALAASGRLPACERTGALLAGDLYVVPDLSHRGGLGDVRPVWRAFADRFRWVAGVAGNHDAFGGDDAFLDFCASPRVHWLDGDAARLDGLLVAGFPASSAATAGRRSSPNLSSSGSSSGRSRSVPTSFSCTSPRTATPRTGAATPRSHTPCAARRTVGSPWWDTGTGPSRRPPSPTATSSTHTSALSSSGAARPQSENGAAPGDTHRPYARRSRTP